MIDPLRQQQLDELEEGEICHDILTNSRNELYLNFRYLDVALSSLGFLADRAGRGVETDGFLIYYQPEHLMSMYKRGRVLINRAFLHMVFHCLLGHMDTRGKRAVPYWNLACDIAIESIIDEFYVKNVYRHQSVYRREVYAKLKEKLRVLTAEGIYKSLQDMDLTEEEYERMTAEFYVDNHEHWEREEDPRIRQERQNKWQNNREKMQTEMESFGEKDAEDSRSLLEAVRVENRERYDYKQFLRRFSVLREENEVDQDSFDYVFYTYGMELYGNMPLIEPLEYSEERKLREMVIVLDTSASCSRGLCAWFLSAVRDILCRERLFFEQFRLHILQCDCEVQQDALVTNLEEFQWYLEHLELYGGGGTDFRPAFRHVDRLIEEGKLERLGGVLYFTDGYGVFPEEAPPYPVTFVMLQYRCDDINIPRWAKTLVLDAEKPGSEEQWI